MKKTTAYARKRVQQGLPPDPSVGRLSDYIHWQRYVTSSLPYGEDTANQDEADAIMAKHRLLFQKLCDRLLPGQDIEAHDAMAHVVDVAKVRIEAIGGEGLADAMGSLAKAAKAVRRTRARWDATGVWGLDGEARTALADALDIYEAVLRASSPKQMQIAQDERIRRLRKFT